MIFNFASASVLQGAIGYSARELHQLLNDPTRLHTYFFLPRQSTCNQFSMFSGEPA